MSTLSDLIASIDKAVLGLQSERDTAKRLLQQVFDQAKVHSSNLGHDLCKLLWDHVEHKAQPKMPEQEPWYAHLDCNPPPPAPDPLASVKQAHKEGKVIEHRDFGETNWRMLPPTPYNPTWDGCEYRVKPETDYRREEGKWIPISTRRPTKEDSSPNHEEVFWRHKGGLCTAARYDSMAWDYWMPIPQPIDSTRDKV